MWCGVVWCSVVWCGEVWCGVVLCGVVWCGMVRCSVVWCGVVWCSVVWCGPSICPGSPNPPTCPLTHGNWQLWLNSTLIQKLGWDFLIKGFIWKAMDRPTWGVTFTGGQKTGLSISKTGHIHSCTLAHCKHPSHSCVVSCREREGPYLQWQP